MIKCLVCNINKNEKSIVKLMKCSHEFCFKCFCEYLGTCLSITIKCPVKDCLKLISSSIIREYLSDQQIIKYENLSNKEIKNLRKCLTVNCPKTIICEDMDGIFICDYCEQPNCLRCGIRHYSAQSCDYKEDEKFIEKAANKAIQKRKAAEAAELEKNKLIPNGESYDCFTCKTFVPPRKGFSLRNCNDKFCSSCLKNSFGKYSKFNQFQCPNCNKLLNPIECEKFIEENDERRLEEEKKMYSLEYILEMNIIGQKSAADLIISTICTKETDWVDNDSPLVFLFLGSSGIGKTEMAKYIATYKHKSKDGFIRLDMSEYQEKHEVSKLIGSPPGYNGHEIGGQLTNALKVCSSAVVLFDEIEKAHLDILTIMLQLFDEGRLTDGKGKTIICKDALFIMTSNLGSEKITNYINNLRRINKTDHVVIDKTFKEKEIRPILKKHFQRDEFLGRISEIIYFYPFSRLDLNQFVINELNNLRKRALTKFQLELFWDDDVVNYLLKDYNESYGARSLKNEVSKKLSTKLAKAHSEDRFKEISKIILVVEKLDNNIVLSKGVIIFPIDSA